MSTIWWRASAFLRSPPVYFIGAGWADGPVPPGEDFGSFGTEWNAPSAFWSWAEQMLTLTRRESGRINDLSVNHSPLFAPVIHPTLQMNVETLVVTAQGWFSSQPTVD